MVAHRRVSRGDVWLIRLDPTVGSEIQKTRPCLIISPPEIHDHLRTVMIAPMTSSSHDAPYRIAARFADKEGRILLDQVRSVDKSRLVKKLGEVDDITRARTLTTLRTLFLE